MPPFGAAHVTCQVGPATLVPRRTPLAGLAPGSIGTHRASSPSVFARGNPTGPAVLLSPVEEARFVSDSQSSLAVCIWGGDGSTAPVAPGTRAQRVEELPEDAQPASRAAASAPPRGRYRFNTRTLCGSLSATQARFCPGFGPAPNRSFRRRRQTRLAAPFAPRHSPSRVFSEPRVRIVVAITGASGALYAQRLLDNLDPRRQEVHVVLSAYAQAVIAEELPDGLRLPDGVRRHGLKSMDVPFVSGSNPFDAMVVIPCTMGTLGRIAHD